MEFIDSAYQIYIDFCSKKSIVTGKNYSEVWFIWLTPKGCVDRSHGHIVGQIINNIYNTDGDSHGYSWNMLPNGIINDWKHSPLYYQNYEEAIEKILSFIKKELEYLK